MTSSDSWRGKLAAVADKAGFGEAAAARRDARLAEWQRRYPSRPPPAVGQGRRPLTTGQHILHLLLTIFTGGLWGIVWIIRAVQGNKVSREAPG